ncbi:hypothetical protein IQ255_29530 [Pleurocapsales cyanobacterium LEGE 10410]|nr:hypothetical protein [Pleurocapsales cyanobacterium LEGE 10410]
MDDTLSRTIDLFQVNQIICLEHQNTCLYGEVIQLIPQRQLCWFRPICLSKINFEHDSTLENAQLIDLQSGSDLLWPITLFRPALDTEIIYLLAELNNYGESLNPKKANRQYLNNFVRQVWQANQERF